MPAEGEDRGDLWECSSSITALYFYASHPSPGSFSFGPSVPMECQRQFCVKEKTGAHLLYWNITARKAMGSLTLEVLGAGEISGRHVKEYCFGEELVRWVFCFWT